MPNTTQLGILLFVAGMNARGERPDPAALLGADDGNWSAAFDLAAAAMLSTEGGRLVVTAAGRDALDAQGLLG